MKKVFSIQMMLLSLATASTALGQPSNVTAATDTSILKEKKTIVVSANAEYNKAGKIRKFYFGEHYRKEWATPVELPVLDLENTAGGLTPVRVGGGKQTKSLRLKGGDGKEYVLRSVNKDPSKAIPRELVGTFADDIVQDQISSSNPYAPLAVASLSQAAKIFHTEPSLVYVPSSAKLGEFKKDFENTVCLLEERPTGMTYGNPSFEYSKKIVNSEKLFEKIFDDPGHRVDQKEFLRARLFDMWIGDWDRHEDQWVWASFDSGDQTVYKPIARDRDQAFSKLDGLIPQMSQRKWALRKTQNFDFKIRDIDGLNMNGVFLDKLFTTELTLNDWVTIASELQSDLTDKKIEAALRMMPDKIFEISGRQIISKLKKRRDDLGKYARAYYSFLSKEINIVGTNQKEIFEISRSGNDSTRIEVYSFDKEQKLHLGYQRTILNKETKEIRLYGLKEDDEFRIAGDVTKGVLIRIIGGEGHDIYNDRSTVKGVTHKTKIYDNRYNNYNSGKEAGNYISADTLKNNYNRRSFRYDWIAPQFAPGYNPDDGVYIGGGVIIKKQKFGKTPYGSMHSIKANYAFETGAHNFWYDGIFKEAIGKWDLHLNAQVNDPNYVFNYFGLGNETEVTSDDKNYNRVRSDQVIASTSISRPLGKYQSLSVGINYQSIKVEESADRFVTNTESKLNSDDFDKKYFGGAKLNYQLNTTDNALFPTQGIKLNSSVEFIQNLNEQSRNFARVSSDVSAFTSIKSLTIAFRVGVGSNLGNDYEFYQANTLGGGDNLRGYRKSRFAGKTSLYENTELRYKFKTANGYFFRGNFGLLAFFDNGRVWMPGENSEEMHWSYGGGVWFMPYNKLAFSITYGVSKEDQLLNIKTGFLF